MKAEQNIDAKPKPRINIPTGALMILPLRNMVLFPSTIMPLVVGRPTSLQVVEKAVRQQCACGIVFQQDPQIEMPQPKDLFEVGTAADILRMFALPDGQRQIIIQGRQRFEVAEYISTDPFVKALTLLPEPMSELRATIERIDNPLWLIDIIASTLDLPVPEKQEILATLDPELRAQKVSEKLARQIELLELSKKIGEETKGSMDRAQRQYFLREQLKAIQKELDEEDGQSMAADELRKKVLEAKMPPEVEKEVLREVTRLERMPEMAAEYSALRTYLDWMVELPWSISSEEQIDLPKAREILDADHYDLEKVKKRIVEFLAVRKLVPHGKSPILCFVGPPGVGKTSLGQSIARAMSRKF